VFLPGGIAGERLAQIEAFHPIVSVTRGSYAQAIRECELQSERRGYLNCNPGARAQKMEGDSTIGVEIAQSLRPDYVVCATNNGTLLAGVWAGMKESRPKTHMIAAVATKSRLAEAISGFHRIEEPSLTKALTTSNGEIVEVSDGEIAHAAQLLVKDGLIVEGAAAATIASLHKMKLKPKTRICCVISGSGMRFPTAVMQLL
jgi:threonine synthase